MKYYELGQYLGAVLFRIQIRGQRGGREGSLRVCAVSPLTSRIIRKLQKADCPAARSVLYSVYGVIVLQGG